MRRTDEGTDATVGGAWGGRLAGGLVIALGVVNLLLGLTSLVSDLILLSDGVAGGLAALGLACVAVGALVWRGSRVATIAALGVFAALLVFQVSELASHTRAADETVADQPVARLAVLGVVVASLALAAWQRRRRPSRRARR